jgi:hypothetical protein
MEHLISNLVQSTNNFKDNSVMNQVQKIACVNNAGFVMSFAIQWQDIHGSWNITKWNSGNYPINETRTSPDLQQIGVNPTTAVLVTPYVVAELGKDNTGSPCLEYQPNGVIGTYQVKGTTFDYSVELIK